jgi:hypothetical protein
LLLLRSRVCAPGSELPAPGVGSVGYEREPPVSQPVGLHGVESIACSPPHGNKQSFWFIGDGIRAGDGEPAYLLTSSTMTGSTSNLQPEGRGRASAWYLGLYMWSLILQQAVPEKGCRISGTKYSRVGVRASVRGGLVRRAVPHDGVPDLPLVYHYHYPIPRETFFFSWPCSRGWCWHRS